MPRANSSEDVLADRDAFLAGVRAGGAVVGIHGAANTLQTWPEFVALLGGEFDYHREQATVRVRVDDPGHPATAGLETGFFPYAWTREEGNGRVFYTGPGHRDDVVDVRLVRPPPARRDPVGAAALSLPGSASAVAGDRAGDGEWLSCRVLH